MAYSKSSFATLFVTFGVLSIAACEQPNEPLAPSNNPTPQAAALAADHNPDQHALGQAIPAFGGLFLDSNGIPTVYLTNASARGAVAAALAEFLADRGVAASQMKVLQARFSYKQLEGFFNSVRPELFNGGGTVFADLDEARNQVVIGVSTPLAVSRVGTLVAAAHLPDGAVSVEHAEPIYAVQTLRDRFDPIPAGVQIHFGNYLCSIGIIAEQNGNLNFVTASHCTNTQGGVESTQYYQPTSSVDGTVIGIEVKDPVYFDRNTGNCPYVGSKCRLSDAALVQATGARAFSLGEIAKTGGAGDLTVSGSFTVGGKSSGNGVVGDSRTKVGRTTGTTTGKVTNSCVDTGVSGSNKVLLCQDWVQGSGTIVGSGDSGSDVFTGSSTVTYWGGLWGGSSDGKTFVYSPTSNIESELGTLNVTGSGGGGGGGGTTLLASFTYSCHFADCSFDASASTGATQYSWTFGDGGTGSGVTTSHKYSGTGSFNVTLTASDGTNNDSVTQTISCSMRRNGRLQCR